MKGLHERLEEQLKKYTARYDSPTSSSSGEYEKYEFYQTHPDTPPSRRQSSAQRRESQKRVVSGGRHTYSLTFSLYLTLSLSLSPPLSPPLSLSSSHLPHSTTLSLNTGSDRSQTVSSRPSSIHERVYDTVQGAMAGVDKRDRTSTEMPRELTARYDTVGIEVSTSSSCGIHRVLRACFTLIHRERRKILCLLSSEEEVSVCSTTSQRDSAHGPAPSHQQ